jgi:4-hydroxybenzoyl-CoA thioesterase
LKVAALHEAVEALRFECRRQLTMSYTTTIPVRFGDVDKAGIVYYPRIFHYLHVAQEDFFGNYAGIPYAEMIDKERLGFPTVTDSTEFFSPLKYGDVLNVTVHVSRLGTSSVVFEFRITRQGSDKVLVRSSQTKVAVNMDTLQKVEIPARYRAAFADCSED